MGLWFCASSVAGTVPGTNDLVDERINCMILFNEPKASWKDSLGMDVRQWSFVGSECLGRGTGKFQALQLKMVAEESAKVKCTDLQV